MKFYVVGYQKKEGDKPRSMIAKNKKRAVQIYDKFFDKKLFRICLLEYFGKTAKDYHILKQAENGEDKTYELLL